MGELAEVLLFEKTVLVGVPGMRVRFEPVTKEAPTSNVNGQG